MLVTFRTDVDVSFDIAVDGDRYGNGEYLVVKTMLMWLCMCMVT